MRSRVQFAETTIEDVFERKLIWIGLFDCREGEISMRQRSWTRKRRAADKVPIDQNVIFSRMKWFSPMIDLKDLYWFIVSLIDKISDWELCGMPEADSKLPLCRTISSLDIVDHLERSDWAKWDCLKSWYTKSRNCSSQDSWRLAYPTPLDSWTLSCQDSRK